MSTTDGEHNRRFGAVTRFVLFSARNSKGGGPYVVERTYDLEEEVHAA